VGGQKRKNRCKTTRRETGVLWRGWEKSLTVDRLSQNEGKAMAQAATRGRVSAEGRQGTMHLEFE